MLSKSYAAIGDYVHALALTEEASRRAEDGDDALHASIDAAYAAQLNQQAKYRDAESVARRALAGLGRYDWPADHARLRILLRSEIARARWAQGDHYGAIGLIGEAIDAAGMLSTESARFQAELLVTRSEWRNVFYRTKQATQDLDRALALAVTIGDEDFADEVRLKRSFAAAERSADSYALADRMLIERERTHGLAHPETGKALLDRSLAALKDARPAQAQADAKRAMAIFAPTLGTWHPLYAEALYLFAFSLPTTRANMASSLAQMARAVDIAKRAYGPFHDRTIRLESNQAMNLISYGEYDTHHIDEALKHYANAIANGERQRLPLPNVRVSYSEALAYAGRNERALFELRRARSEISEYIGEDSDVMTYATYVQADVHFNLKQYAQAERLYLETTRKSANAQTVTYRQLSYHSNIRLGQIAFGRRQSALARKHWLLALEGATSSEGPDSSTVLSIKQRLADLD